MEIPKTQLNVVVMLDEEIWEIEEKAILHYKHRLELLVNKEDSQELKLMLKDQLDEKLKLLEEMSKYWNKKDMKQRKDQWDRYRIPLCKILLLYKEDFENVKKLIGKFGAKDFEINTKELDRYGEKIDRRVSNYNETIAALKGGMYFDTF